MKSVIAIDPGSDKSAYVIWDGKTIQNANIVQNEELLSGMGAMSLWTGYDLVIEQIRCYGMTMGATLIDTVFWSGRFCQAWGKEFFLVPRMDVKMHLCNTSRAKDKNIRQALIDRFGPVPTKKRLNPIYGGNKISKDLWQSWALSVTYYDKQEGL
uniref:Uncharacterized protein n=1 Tax=viral metagenome TaxID=1070528 RepID=A0A6M3LE03_9ZZZZ